MGYKDEIIKLRESGNTYNEINKILGCSLSTISFHCRKNGLSDYNTYRKPTDSDIKLMQEVYDKCGSSIKTAKELGWSKFTILKYITIKKLNKYEVYNNSKKSVSDWRKRTKIKLVEYKGGKCEVCGYDKMVSVLQFHHNNPLEKDFTISGKSWSYEKLRLEVDKCILLCANCHLEIHENIRNEKR